MTRTGLACAALLVAATSLGWLGLDPHAPVRDANRLYAEGKYEEATAAYNAALVDRPDSPELHFNRGASTYKEGKYDEAISAFQKVETANDPGAGSRVAYNVGNATFRQGQALEQSEPQKALELYAQALASYRRALGLNPDDEDTKFNHELVAQRIKELKQRLEEQKKEQQQQDQQQPGDQNQDQPQQDQQQQPEEQQGEQPQDQEQKNEQQQAGEDQPQDQPEQQDDQPQAGGDPPDEPKPEEQQAGPPSQADQQQPPGEPQPGGEAVAGEETDGELSKGEAAAILDSQRGEEVSPEDIIEKLQGGRVAEPAQDW